MKKGAKKGSARGSAHWGVCRCGSAWASKRSRVGLGPVLASRAPSPPAAAAAAWRGRGRVPQCGVEIGRSRTSEGSLGGRKKGVVCGVGQERLGPSYFFISLVLGPLNNLLWYVPSSRYIWSSAPILFLQEQIKGIIISASSPDLDRKKKGLNSIYTLRKVRTIRGCLEGLAPMI